METGKLRLLPDRHTDFVFSVSATPWIWDCVALAALAARTDFWWVFRR